MKILAISAAAVFAVFSAQYAYATDLNNPGGYANPYDAPMKVNWSGFYVGGAIGYGNANHDLSVRDYFKDFCVEKGNEPEDPFEDGIEGTLFLARQATIGNVNDFFAANPKFPFPTCESIDDVGSVDAGDIVTLPGDSREVANLDGLNSTGVVGDLRLGYDQKMGRFVLGVFGTYGFSGMDADGELTGQGNFSLERGDDWSIGARAGALVNDRTLLYILAAYTQTEYDLDLTIGEDNFNETTTFSGITVGGGIEFAVNQNVFLKAEEDISLPATS